MRAAHKSGVTMICQKTVFSSVSTYSLVLVNLLEKNVRYVSDETLRCDMVGLRLG